MKRIYNLTMYNVQCIVRIVMLLVIFGFQLSVVNSVKAQDAFYIYQNDGHFDGFFYDQVESINYSKIDTLGRECLDYVVQEIVTADSTYRIMLSAIDSVSFVQPEIKLNPLLRKMDELGQTDYFDHIDEQGDNVTLYFKGTMPEGLVPKVGEVLTGFDEAVYGHDGYVGKVAAVSRAGGYVVCQMKCIDNWGDLFEQFVTVEQVGYYDNGQMARRMAGVSDAEMSRLMGKRRIMDDQGNLDITLFSWGGRLQYEESPFSVGIDVTLEAKLNITYRADKDDFYMKATMSENFSASPSIHVNSGGNKEKTFNTPIAFPGIKFPAAVPIFETNPTPKGFVRVNGSADIGVKLPTLQLPLAQSFIIDTAHGAENFIHAGFTWGSGSDEDSEKVLADKWFDDSMDANFVLNGFIQAGSKVEFTVTTNRWIENFFFASIGWEIYSGPKIEMELNLSAAGLINNGAYGLLKDSRVGFTGFSVDTEAKAKIFIRGYDETEKTLWSDNMKFLASDWFLFPDFEDSEAEFNQEKGTVDAKVFPHRQTCWLVDIGIGLYDSDDNRIYEAFKGEDYGLNNTYNEVKHSFVVEGLPSDVYNVVPLVKILGVVLPVKEKAAEVEVINNKLEVTPKTFDIDGQAQTVESELETSAETVTLKSSDDSWLTATRHGYLIKITSQALPEDKPVRTGSIYVDATFPDKTTKQVRIDVVQSGEPGKPVVVLTPDSLGFGAGNESQTIQITSNTETLTCSSSESWIHPTINDGVLTVSVDGSTQSDERKGTVTVKGSLNGKEASAELQVTQRAPITLVERDLMFTAEGGTKQVTVILGGDLTVTAEPEDDWLSATYSEGKLQVTAEENFETAPRNSKVKVKTMVGNQEVAVELNVTQKAYIVLTPNVIECDKKGGVFTVDIETDLTKVTIDAVTNWVGLAISSDRKRLTVSVEPNDTGHDRQGSGLVSARKSDGTTISSSIIVKQSGDEEAPPTSLVMQEITSSKITPNPDGCNKTIYITCNDWPGMAGQTYVFDGEWIIAYNGLAKNDMYEDIFDAFRHNDVIPRNDDGTFAVKTKELTLNGKFDDETNVSASGTFSIDASFVHQRKTVAEAERLIHEGGDVESLNMLLNATISHQITGTFTCQWNDETQLYDFHFTGSGPFQISGTYFNQMTGSWEIAGYPTVPHPDAVITGTAEFADEGTTTVDITISYLWQE